MSKLARIREHLSKAEYSQAQQLLEAEYSHSEISGALYSALRANRTAPDGSYIYRWIHAVYDSHLIYEEEIGDSDKLYKADYSVSEDGVATISNAVEVRIEYVPVATSTDLTESAKPLEEGRTNGSYAPLKERAIRPDGTMQIKIIGPGEGSSGYYSREVIERDIPKVFPNGTQMMADHMTATEEAEQPEGKIRNLAAVFVSDPYYLEESAAPEGEGSYVDVKAFADYAPMLEDKAEAIGVSINGGGDISFGEVNGKQMPIIERITVGKSVDFVTKAGRDGKIVSLKESRRLREAVPQNTPGEPTNPTTPISESGEDVNEQDTKKLQEAQTRAETAEAEVARLKEAAILTESAKYVGEVLGGIEMSEMTRERLAESLGKNPVLKDGAIDRDAFKTKIEESAAIELEYLQKVTGIGDGQPKNLGGAAPDLKESATPAGIASMRAEIGLV